MRRVSVKRMTSYILCNGLNRREMAQMINVDSSRVLRWQKGDPLAFIDSREMKLLRDLYILIALLRETLTPKGVRQWVRTFPRTLAGRRPIECFCVDPDAVFAAASSFVQGDYI